MQNDPTGDSVPAVIVTGASEGLGREIARWLVWSGYRAVLLVARNGVALDDLARELRMKGKVEARVLVLDLLEPGADGRIEARLKEAGWHAEVLVNNAGSGLSGPFTGQDPDAIQRLIRLNAEVPALLTRRFVPDMCRRGRGGVINIASLGGYVPGPWQAAYYASKAFLVSLSKSVGQEVRWSGVRVTVVAPGPLATRFHEKMGAHQDRYLWMFHQANPRWIAAAAIIGFRLGARVVFPGPLTFLLAVASRFTPDFILSPIMGWLLGRPRKWR